MSDVVATVDQVPPTPKLLALGLQHVLVMYAGAVAVPLIIGRALRLPPEQVALLVNADLFACGIATLIQSLGIGPFGIRLPVMMGVTFAAVGPMLAMAGNPELGLLGIFGSCIGAGIFTILVAPFVSRLLPLFPPIVTGAVILMIGISLMRVGVNWAAGAPGWAWATAVASSRQAAASPNLDLNTKDVFFIMRKAPGAKSDVAQTECINSSSRGNRLPLKPKSGEAGSVKENIWSLRGNAKVHPRKRGISHLPTPSLTIQAIRRPILEPAFSRPPIPLRFPGGIARILW